MLQTKTIVQAAYMIIVCLYCIVIGFDLLADIVDEDMDYRSWSNQAVHQVPKQYGFRKIAIESVCFSFMLG